MTEYMPILDWTKIILPSVIPAVIISAVGILSQTIYTRISLLAHRLHEIEKERIFYHKELMTLTEEKKLKELQRDYTEFLEMLDNQVDELIYRIKLMRKCQIAFLISIASFVLTSCLIGLSVFYFDLSFAVLIFYMFGLCSMMVGLSFALKEIRRAGSATLAAAALLNRFFKKKKKRFS